MDPLIPLLPNSKASTTSITHFKGITIIAKIPIDNDRYHAVSHGTDVPLPVGTRKDLTTENPLLVSLQRAYDQLKIDSVIRTQWKDSFVRENITLPYFRGDNAYMWQYRQMKSEAKFRTYLALIDVKAKDELHLLNTLAEDGVFGAHTFRFGNRSPLSRDLLDSINEINYLDKIIGVSRLKDLRVLDIGAGYGRLAYRMAHSLSNIERYDCMDGVAISSFLCHYYLNYRALPERIRTIFLQDYEQALDRYDLAVNIHSWSECSLAAIKWWISFIASRKVRWILIIPNRQGELLSVESDGSKCNFRPCLEEAGYALIDRRPIYESDELRSLIRIQDEFWLFETPTN